MGESKKKEIYIISHDIGETVIERCVKLTEEQYKAILWLLDEFNGAEVTDLCVWKLNEFEPEEIE